MAKGNSRKNAPAGARSTQSEAIAERQTQEASGTVPERGLLESVTAGAEALHRYGDGAFAHGQTYYSQSGVLPGGLKPFDMTFDPKAIRERAVGDMGEAAPLGCRFIPTGDRVTPEDGKPADRPLLIIPHTVATRGEVVTAIFAGIALAQCIDTVGKNAGKLNKGLAREILNAAGFVGGMDPETRKPTPVKNPSVAFARGKVLEAIRATVEALGDSFPSDYAATRARPKPSGANRSNAFYQCGGTLSVKDTAAWYARLPRGTQGKPSGATVKSILGGSWDPTTATPRPCPFRVEVPPLVASALAAAGRPPEKFLSCPWHGHTGGFSQTVKEVKLGAAQAANRALAAPDPDAGPTDAELAKIEAEGK